MIPNILINCLCILDHHYLIHLPIRILLAHFVNLSVGATHLSSPLFLLNSGSLEEEAAMTCLSIQSRESITRSK
jgi:hypothetical protein